MAGGAKELFSPASLWTVRYSLEDLATKCLRDAVTAALILSGNQAEKVDWRFAGQIAVRMAFAIRGDVAKGIERLIADEGADEFLRTLALDQGRKIDEEKA